jgi:hypothetical protein
VLQTCAAQTVSSYTDKLTGIQLATWGFLPNATDPDSIPASAAFTFGMALPGDALDKDANEYIGVLVSAGLAGNGALKSPTDNYRRGAARLARRPRAGVAFRMVSPDK